MHFLIFDITISINNNIVKSVGIELNYVNKSVKDIQRIWNLIDINLAMHYILKYVLKLIPNIWLEC